MSRAVCAIALLLVSGCAFESGEPFGVVSATLDAHYELRDDRDVGGGFQRLTNEYEVKLEVLVLAVDLVELVDTGEVTTTSFDPASPPPGYSLCHGGHCHADDGRLVDYDDIAAELAEAEGGSSVMLRLTSDPIDLLAAAPVPLACEGSCLVGTGHAGRIRASLASFEVKGRVRDGIEPPRFDGERGFAATISLLAAEGETAATLDAEVAIPFDDAHEPEVSLVITLRPTAALFDGVAFADLASDQERTFALGDDLSARTSILEAWNELALGAHVERPE